MDRIPFKILEKKILMNVDNNITYTSEELLKHDFFKVFITKTIKELNIKRSPLLNIFGKTDIDEKDIDLFIEALVYLTKLGAEYVPKIVENSQIFFQNKETLNDFVEYVYNYWREFDRFIICSSDTTDLDKKPYRVFNETIENLMHIVRKAYRDIQENITSEHPSIYRQVRAGAEIAAITSKKHEIALNGLYNKVKNIPMTRQILLYPPLILNPPMNKRKGKFLRVDSNPLEKIDINTEEWLCYPAKVGELLIYVYIHEKFLELGLSMCNLFELASDDELTGKPDGVYVFGVPGNAIDNMADDPTIFYEDKENKLIVAAVPNRDEFGYFGYLKKMILTIHNINIMRQEDLPFHGALVKIAINNGREATVLLIGDSGAGKSETLEALRILGDKHIREMKIIADDMGSIKIDSKGVVKGYGTEIGAYVRLDDLQPGYAFGQLDRTIIMNPSQINARAILPVTTYANIIRGHKIDFILYANNYEPIDEDHMLIEKFNTPSEAIKVFKEGAVMSKGTTTATGLTNSYFANIFGPPEYKDLHDKIADKYFKAFFDNGIFVGQIRTKLGIPGNESTGPKEAAEELLSLI
ncbi:MAG: phosphoenolpyruvate carboxykinase [bacterium]|nr:phosphoenolpyruvate carboxykinase [bacterium]